MQEYKAGITAVWKEVVTPILLIVLVMATLIVAFAGPFGTYDSLSFLQRIFYWGGLISVSISIGLLFRMFWRVVLNSSSPLLEDVLVLTGLGIVFGPIVVAVNNFFWPDTNQLALWPFATFLTFLIGGCAVALRHLIQNRDDATVALDRDRLLDRIGAPSDARLCRISSDNHHIRITVGDGQEFRVLMRLRDAIADVDVEPGYCVHRSHWVAAFQVRAVEVEDGREVVHLACGTTLPVGPKYRPNLVEAGVLSA